MTINQITWKWLSLVVLISIITGFWGGVIYSDRVYRKLEVEKNKGDHGWSQLPEGHPPVGESISGKQNSLSQLEDQAKREPTNPDLQVNLGNIYADQNDYLKAIDHYERALILNPNIPDVWVDCGIMYQEAKQANKAIQYFQKAISLNPHHALAYYNMGVVYRYDMKELEKSNVAWKKYLEIDTSSPQARQVEKLIKSGQ